MKVGVLCEESGVVRDAFAARGHDAWSCDILPRAGKHIRGDCLEQDWSVFDLLICFPPCTYLCSSGLHRNKGNPRREEKTKLAAKFVTDLWSLDVPMIAIENPIGRLSRCLGPPTQIIQPYEFGHDASKSTCLWLRGLPPLTETKFIPPGYACPCGSRFNNHLGKYGCPNCEGMHGPARHVWANQTNSGQNREPPGHMRARKRSVTYSGIANAMADQWGSIKLEIENRG